MVNNKKARKPWTKSKWEVFSMAMIGVVILFIFAYLPMCGLVLAFKEGNGYLNITKAIFDSDWAGFDNFKEFLLDKDFTNILVNTLGLNILQLFINFPAPIIFALLINEVRNERFKKVIQSITYLPHFLSWVVFAGIVFALINMDYGIINKALISFGIIDEAIDIKGDAQYFWGLIIITSLLKGVGWGSIIYLAALSSIDGALYEAATIDGANRFHRMVYVSVPSIAPTIVMFMLLSISSLLNNGVEHILAFQNQSNLDRSEVIDTFVLKYGIRKNMYSYASAVGFFKSVIALVLITVSDTVCKKITGQGVVY